MSKETSALSPLRGKKGEKENVICILVLSVRGVADEWLSWMTNMQL